MLNSIVRIRRIVNIHGIPSLFYCSETHDKLTYTYKFPEPMLAQTYKHQMEETYKRIIAKEAQPQKTDTHDLGRMAADRAGWRRLLSAL